MKMSSEDFENLDEELKSLIDALKKKLDNQIPRLSGEERKKIVREIERKYEDAFSKVEEMEKEVYKAPQPYRLQMNAKVRKYREELNKLSTKVKQLTVSNTATFTRQELFAGEDASMENPIAGQRSRVMQTSAVLDRTSQSIARSQMVAVETEQIGHEIISEMGEQRESLLRAQANLSGTDANLIQSRKILKTMYLRVMTNKLILAVIILMEVGILIGVVYWKFFR